MKLSELRPCDNCGGKISPIFHIVRHSIAAVDAVKTNRFLGLVQFYGGNIDIAGVMDDSEVVIESEKEAPGLTTALFICNTCYCEKSLNIGELVEKVNHACPEIERT